jgi:hypothetical protein
MCTVYSICYKKKDVYRKTRKKDGVAERNEEEGREACMLRKERSRAELSEKLPFA